MKKKSIKKSRKGAALVISMFIALIGAMITIVMMGMADTNTTQITDNRGGLLAYYAAEAGVADVKSYLNQNIDAITEAPASIELTDVGLTNDATYSTTLVSYDVDSKTVIVDVVGNYGSAHRKIRIKLKKGVPSVFDDYGLLTNGTINLNGQNALDMNIHANGGLNIPEEDRIAWGPGAIGTQSTNPDPAHNSYEIVPEVYVPNPDIDELRTQIQDDENCYTFNINDETLADEINSVPDGGKIYISTELPEGEHGQSGDTVVLSGNMQGKTVFIDGADINIDIDEANPLSNANIITAGSMSINGGDAGNITTSHEDQIDTSFISGGDTTLGGSASYTALFWTSGEFNQNGTSALTGRIIANDAIFAEGGLVQTSSDPLADDNNLFDRTVSIKSWQQVPYE